jgi:thiamine biosynthesis lipoprotein
MGYNTAMKRTALGILLIVTVAAAVTGWSEPLASPNPSWGGQTMGSTYSVKLADTPLNAGDLEQLKADTEKLLSELNRQMSHYQPDSEISRFNKSTSTAPFRVSPEFSRAAHFARELYDRSGGAFDPTLGPLINAWGFGPRGRRDKVPEDAEIRAAKDICGGGHFSVTAGAEIIKELQLNMSAVVAGFAADEVAALLRARGLTNYFVDITTEIVVSGHNPEGKLWRIGLETPNAAAAQGEELEAVLNVSQGAVSTSGDYRNYFEDEKGNRFSHILDPHTARPIEHHLGSVTVVAGDGMTADGLATTLFVMGPDEGLPWLKSWPGAEALFIIRNADGTYTEVASPGFERITGYKPK